MVATQIRRIVLGIVFGVVAAFSAGVAAQSGSFTNVVPLDRVGEPWTETVNTTDPITLEPTTMVVDKGAFSNPCTSEYVDVSGTSTVSSLQTVDKFGTMKVSVSVVSKGQGLGWVPSSLGPVYTGSTYSFNESQQFSFRLPSVGDEFSSDFSEKFSLRGTKSIDNWVARAHFRIKVNTAGEVQVLLMKMSGDPVCKG